MQLQHGVFEPPEIPGVLGKIDRFAIVRLLGQGGMGQVYLAREPPADAPVALKVMRLGLVGKPRLVSRFLDEARHMSSLSHPNILRVLDVSDRREGAYYVMPYIAGGSLQAHCAPGRLLPPRRILNIAGQIAGALVYAHQQGIIHRDLKPANVLLDDTGKAYLTDFGLSRTVFNDSIVEAGAGKIEGTPPYLSPAMARGEAEDTRCDIYAFGALLYEALTGRPPYIGDPQHAVAEQILAGPPPPIRSVNPKADPKLTAVAEGCMARELRDRYAAMDDVAADLDRISGGRSPIGVQCGKSRSVNRPAWLAAGLLACVGAGVIATLVSVRKTGAEHAAAVNVPKGASSARSATNGPAAASSPVPLVYVITNGAAAVKRYAGNDAAVAIPPAVDGVPVVAVDDYAFQHNTTLTSIHLPASVSRIGPYAFESSVVAAFDVDPANPVFCCEDGVLFDKDRKTLIAYPPGKGGNYEIPEGVARIGHAAFSHCLRLSNVMIPASVRRLDSAAFRNCESLRVVRFDGRAPVAASDSFKACPRAQAHYFVDKPGWREGIGGILAEAQPAR